MRSEPIWVNDDQGIRQNPDMSGECPAEFRSRKCLGKVGKSSPTYVCDRCGHARRYCTECAATWVVSLARIAEKEQRRSTLHDIVSRVNSERWYRKGFSSLIKHQACEKRGCGGVYCPSANIPTFEDIAAMKPTAQSLTPGARRRPGAKRTTQIEVDEAEEEQEQVKTREKIVRQREKELANQLAIEEVKRAIAAKKKKEEDKPRPASPPRSEEGEEEMPPLEDGVVTALREEIQAMAEAHRQEMAALKQTFAAGITRMQREVIDVCARLNAKIDAVGAACADLQAKHGDLSRRISALETPDWMTSGSSNPWDNPPAF